MPLNIDEVPVEANLIARVFEEVRIGGVVFTRPFEFTRCDRFLPRRGPTSEGSFLKRVQGRIYNAFISIINLIRFGNRELDWGCEFPASSKGMALVRSCSGASQIQPQQSLNSIETLHVPHAAQFIDGVSPP